MIAFAAFIPTAKKPFPNESKKYPNPLWAIRIWQKMPWIAAMFSAVNGILWIMQLVNYPALKGGAWIWTPPQFPEPLQAFGFDFIIRLIGGC